GYARGAVTGLGVLNILLGVWEIINFKKTARAFQMEWQGEKSYSQAPDSVDIPDNRPPTVTTPDERSGTEVPR
ncbi:MAG: hypothetical protein WAV20_17195, partial [Blastocatellia bacterium]